MNERLWGPFRYWGADGCAEELGFYEGFFARFYDRTTFGDKTGAEHYLRLAESHTGPLLEPFCGTGRVLLRLAHHGHHVVGFDNSDVIMSLLQQRIALLPEETRTRVSVLKADAREFDLGRRFPLVIVPANSLALLDRADDRLRFLRCAHRHLAADGTLAFDYLCVDDNTATKASGRLTTVQETVDAVTYVSTFGIRFDEDRGLFNIRIEELRANAPPRRRLATFAFSRMRHLDIEAALEDAGFELVERSLAEDELAGLPVSRCSLRARPQSACSYPLWHPHLPMNDVGRAVTVLAEGRGVHVRDIDGNEYIDACSGLWSTSLGLGRSEVIDAITRQLHRLSYGTLFALRSNESAIELARLLVELTPQTLTRAYLTCSGSESIELAIKLARLHHALRGTPERMGIAYLDRSYHGTYYGSMGVTALHPGRERTGPGVGGLIAVPTPPPTPEGDHAPSVRALEQAIVDSGERIAAFIFEPVLGSAGCVVPDARWFPAVADVCRRHDVLIVVDEVATGFGRTGRWFACEHFGIRPDMLALSKGIDSGYLPLGALLFTERLAETLLQARSGIAHGSSANGNPACCAAAVATIGVMRDEHLVERAAALGTRLAERLTQLVDGAAVDAVRGIGLMWSIELAGTNPSVVGHALRAVQEAGVLAYPYERGLSLFPALTITECNLDAIVDRIAASITASGSPR